MKTKNFAAVSMLVSITGLGCNGVNLSTPTDIASPPPMAPNTMPTPVPSPSPSEEEIRFPRSHWYTARIQHLFVEDPIPPMITACVFNKTNNTQKIGIGVYKIWEDGSLELFSESYSYVEANNRLEHCLGSVRIPNCAFVLFVSQIEKFHQSKVNANSDGYLITSYSSDELPFCKE